MSLQMEMSVASASSANSVEFPKSETVKIRIKKTKASGLPSQPPSASVSIPLISTTQKDIMKMISEETHLENLKKHIEENAIDMEGTEVLSHLGDYIEEPYTLIESYFAGQYLERLVRHQVESYNHFINFQILKTIQMFNPVIIRSENDYVEENGKYFLEIFVSFENFKLYPPQIHENNGATKLMLPHEAKLRNFTYASNMTIDLQIQYIIRNTDKMDSPKIINKTLQKINIGKMPIMLKSSICVLTQNRHIPHKFTGECPMDCGGYFIIKGSEKTVLGQERAAENRVYCFDGKNTTKWTWFAEIKSVPDFKCISPKQIEMMIMSKGNGFGNGIFVTVPRIKQPIELFVLFRALGILSDKSICEYIVLDIEDEKYSEILKFLKASVIDANKYITTEDALKHITSFVAYTPINMDKETGSKKKREFAIDVLNNDLFPHCKTFPQKLYLLGYMASKLIKTSFGWLPPDDRDSYLNKRIELTGTLLNNLFRNYFNKLVKEMQKQVVREINNGSWRSTEDYENIINTTNIYKIMKSTTIENGITRALSTGDFSIKQANSTKVGVAQVLNRLTYMASMSHLRRINTPLEKCGELIAPRKLHNTTWGFLCLTGDTEVLMSDRITIKKIKDMNDGDRVNTVNPETLLDEPSDIHSFFKKMPDKLYEITTISGRKIKATANHPFLINNNGSYEWKNLEDLKIDDKVIIRHTVKDICDENNYNTELFPIYKLKIIATELVKIKEFRKSENFTSEFIYQTYLNGNVMNKNYISVAIFSIEEIKPEFVYDFTTYSDNHSFVASSFVTHNCPAETPEGASIGVVKNISYMAHLTIPTNSSSLYEYVEPYIITIDQVSAKELYEKVKVFVNGAWVGISTDPMNLYNEMKEKKYKGIINIYTSIVFDFKNSEIRICSDGGRLTRPVLRVKDGKAIITKDIIDKISKKELSWNDLLTSCKLHTSMIEYIDPEEQNNSMIAMKVKNAYLNDENTKYNYTHCEIHPSTIFGLLASCTPYPEHNQAPRNTYQCAMGKQAIGVYAMNYDERMDKTSYVLTNPSRPLVDTRLMNFIQLNRIPSGCQIHVAIMTHTGYNQEDSVLVNKGSIDRGLFSATIYHTEKDEDKNIIRDEIIRCKPDPTKTKGIKFGNYDKLNSQGFIPENTLVENRDIIIAKIIPIKENRNDHTKVIKYEDQSRAYSTAEETYIDKNYTGRNGDGYNFAKVRVRIHRKPVFGDKFCSLPTQQVLTNLGWVEMQHLDIKKHSVCTLDRDGNMMYEMPSAKFIYDHDGPMYSVCNKQVEVICTLNHKLYVQKRSSKTYELIEAQDVMGKMVRFQKAVNNVYPDIEWMELDDKKYKMDDWLQLLGMFISDGSTNGSCVYISALKERKVKFNTEILNKLELEFTHNTNSGNFGIPKKKYPEIYEELDMLSVGALNKQLPNYVWDLSQRQCIILLEALLQGDGHTMKYKGEDEFSRYGTISIKLADDISRLATHCGYSGIVKLAEEPTGIARIGKHNMGGRAGEAVSITQKHTYYKVSIIRKQNQPWINKKVNGSNVEHLIDYTGKVYCVEMPTSHLYYMRETKYSAALLVGNSSRHGQKGTCGNIIPECDMPFTKDGLRPDIIINPHAIPSRMTIGQLKETLLGKVLLELGMFGDGTSFGNLDIKTITEELQKLSYESYGNEILYNGLTGEQLETSIFIGPVFYQRLKHMVNDKVHSRATGPMVSLTHQPAEGRSRAGGLRIGEMERDVIISHGATRFCKERLFDVSDKYTVNVCKKCGMIAACNDGNNNNKFYTNSDFTIHLCKNCGNRTEFSLVDMPYANKLLFQELQTINIVPRIITEN